MENTLRHMPEFELPINTAVPVAPNNLISLIEECYLGLSKIVVSKMIRRGKYDQIATIIYQETPSKKTQPAASADEIAEYCMMCIQYDINKTDELGDYKVTLFGPPGKGRFERSQHVTFNVDKDMNDAKEIKMEDSTNQLNSFIKLADQQRKAIDEQAKIIENQAQYIGELHSQVICLLETLSSHAQDVIKERKIEKEESSKRLEQVMEIVKDAHLIEALVSFLRKK